MFYCQKCREKNDWPKRGFVSYGPCELCGAHSDCNDVPSSMLPEPKKKEVHSRCECPADYEVIVKSAKALLDYVAFEHEIKRKSQFNCPHMHDLAIAVDWVRD